MIAFTIGSNVAHPYCVLLFKMLTFRVCLRMGTRVVLCFFREYSGKIFQTKWGSLILWLCNVIVQIKRTIAALQLKVQLQLFSRFHMTWFTYPFLRLFVFHVWDGANAHNSDDGVEYILNRCSLTWLHVV